MRVVFMGTPSFAVPSLRAVAARHEVSAVFTRADRASGRGAHLRPSEVKVAAEELGLTVVQPPTLKGEAATEIGRLRPDVICVAAFGMILPPEVLEIPRFGCINVHASLLPRYRGAAPVQRAILAGDAETGISIMQMEEGLDTGPFALQRTVRIDGRYAQEVEDDLARVGAAALMEVLEKLEGGGISWTEQDDEQATYAAKITKDDVALTPDLSVSEAFARVRASTHRAAARACVGDRELTVLRATPVDSDIAAGSVCLVDGTPLLGFTDSALRLEIVRPAGKGDMSGAQWACGARLSEDACWRCTR